MAEWWESAPLAPPITSPAEGGNWWEGTKQVAQPLIPSADPDQANILPLRRTPQGPQFDPTAGVLGSLLRTITTPGDIKLGNIPTPYGGGSAVAPDAVSRAAESAWGLSPVSPAYRAGARFGSVAPLGETTLNPLASTDRALLGGMRSNQTKAPLTPPTVQEISAAAATGENRAAPGRVPILSQAERTEMLQTARGNREAATAAKNAEGATTPTQNVLEWYGQRYAGNNLPSALLSSLPAIAHGGWKGLLASVALRGSGDLANAAANALARGQTRVAEELARSNSPLARSLIEQQHLSYSPGAGRDAAVMRLLGPGLLDEPIPQSRLPPGYI